MTSGTFFQRLILEGGRGDNMAKSIGRRSSDTEEDVGHGDDAPWLTAPDKIRRVIFCSGKVC